MQQDLTHGNIFQLLLRFSLPYLLSCFLQTFYGLADLFITGQFNGASTISAVSIGSQIMHMFVVIVAGLAMGATVTISRAVGAGHTKEVSKSIGNAAALFLLFAIIMTGILIVSTDSILALIATPAEALTEARQYLLICFAGVPFIIAYNVISAVFRGIGDSKSPMYFVCVAGIINILLDYLLIGPFHMGAAGAAFATVISQTISVIFALTALFRLKMGISISKKDFILKKQTIIAILRVGIPVALQDGLIQVSFLVITAIANQRGVQVAAGVGIVEKIISFLFLVPSAMLSSVSAIAAQNAGAEKHQRGITVLKYGIAVSIGFGVISTTVCELAAEQILGLFANRDIVVIQMGSQYLRAYVIDSMIAGIHFCFSGYFCAYGKAFFSFIHNIISIAFIRIPGAYLASVLFPDTLFPMGLAAPCGSLLSVFICMIIFLRGAKHYDNNRRKRKSLPTSGN